MPDKTKFEPTYIDLLEAAVCQNTKTKTIISDIECIRRLKEIAVKIHEKYGA